MIDGLCRAINRGSLSILPFNKAMMNQNKKGLLDKSSGKFHILAKLSNGEASLFGKTKRNFLNTTSYHYRYKQSFYLINFTEVLADD